jgi:hypothetical protein
VDYYLVGIVGYVFAWILALLCFFTIWAVNSMQVPHPYSGAVTHSPGSAAPAGNSAA